MASRNFYAFDSTQFANNVVQEMRILNIQKGGTLKKEEYQELLQYIYKDCIEEQNALKPLKRGMVGIQLITMIGTIGRKKYKETRQGIKQLRKGAKIYHKNFSEVLNGITITSNYMSSNNLMNVINQREAAREYSSFYVSFVKEFCDKMECYHKNSSTLVNREHVQKMEESRKKVLNLSRKYQRQKTS